MSESGTWQESKRSGKYKDLKPIIEMDENLQIERVLETSPDVIVPNDNE
jgi:hypothetical protein